MFIKSVRPAGGFASNCYLLVSGKEAVLVDPSEPVENVREALLDSGADLKEIWLTHGHFDHILHLRDVKKAFGVIAKIHVSEVDFPQDGMKNAYALLMGSDISFGEIDGTFSDQDMLNVGDETVRVIHTPGHTQGSCVFETSAGLITGDTLFSMGHGRTDLYSGDDEQMLQSLMKLQKMSGRLRIYPGHGGGSTLSAALWDCGLTGRNELL